MDDADLPKTLAQVKNSALKILALREHTHHEMSVKLASRGIASSVIDSVLQTLDDEGMLSDERAASEYIRQRVGKGYGERKVRAELLQKGVDDACIDDCFADAMIDWQPIAQRAFDKKFAFIANTDQKLLMKQQRFLLSRGFSGDIIKGVLQAPVAS